jgi:hypothetical protein
MAGVVCDEGGQVWLNGGQRAITKVLVSVLASQTDSPIVAAVANMKVHILGFKFQAAGTPSTVVLTSKPGGAGSSISQVFSPTASLMFGEPLGSDPLYSTVAGEGLAMTTGAGGTTTGVLWYALAP